VIAGLILAAGGGSRYGTEPKLLADIAGRPVIERTTRAMTQVQAVDRVIVVLGAYAPQILAGAQLGRAEPVICTDWEEGQSASLRCGVRALEEAEKILVILGDQPLMSTDVVERLSRYPPGSRASYHGVPGHPVVLGPQHHRPIEQLSGDDGARDLLDGPLVESADLGIPRDLDTRNDLTRIRGEAFQRPIPR
jgi:molybdenum cofactor cytidylyltransferase